MDGSLATVVLASDLLSFFNLKSTGLYRGTRAIQNIGDGIVHHSHIGGCGHRGSRQACKPRCRFGCLQQIPVEFELLIII